MVWGQRLRPVWHVRRLSTGQQKPGSAAWWRRGPHLRDPADHGARARPV